MKRQKRKKKRMILGGKGKESKGTSRIEIGTDDIGLLS